jgi:hypothetical protein
LTSATLADLQAIERLIEGLPPESRKALESIPAIRERLGKWRPNPGPQEQAYYSKADCLLYGGQPGGGKTSLILGLAFNEHKRTLIMRREYGGLDRIIEDALKIHGSRDGFNGSPPPRLKIDGDRVIYFRAAHRVGDEQGTMGQGRDLLAIDEATQFAESQVRFMMGWVRSEDPRQRCRTVLATNPPLQAEGLWVVKMFAPWIDERYPRPALPGELRWVVSDAEGNDEWVEGADDTREVAGKVVRPTSRTYIPASTKDNPYYVDSDYERQLDAMPEPFRSLLMGGFKTQFRDDDNQLIPTVWVKAAQARWKADGWKEFDMTAMALDPAGGGPDKGVLAWRHGGWYAPLVVIRADQDGDSDDPNASAERAMLRASKMAASVIMHRRASAPVIVDMGGGYGGDVSARLKENGIAYQSFNGAEKSTFIGKEGVRYVNRRALAWWQFRDELNPDREGGSLIALPNDPELLADLTAPRFEMTRAGVKIEDKDEIKKRLGRSPDKGDAAVMCLAPGNKAVKRVEAMLSRGGKPLQAKLGYASAKRGKR